MQLAYGAFYGVPGTSVSGPGFEAKILAADPGRIVTRHGHEGAHIVAILSGRYLSLAAPGAVLAPADIVFNPAHTEHCDTFDSRDGTFLAVAFDPEHFPIRINARPTPRLLASLQSLRAAVALLALLRRWQHADPGDVEAAVLALAECAFVEPGGDHRYQTKPPPSWLAQAHERILDHRDSHISVARLARAANMHPVSFSRAFRQRYGLTPQALSLETRLQRASADLARTGKPIAVIAQDHGFFDQPHFSRHFYLKTGASPGAFRAQFRS
jgi:AraC family transcriptional regulator